MLYKNLSFIAAIAAMCITWRLCLAAIDSGEFTPHPTGWQSRLAYVSLFTFIGAVCAWVRYGVFNALTRLHRARRRRALTAAGLTRPGKIIVSVEESTPVRVVKTPKL